MAAFVREGPGWRLGWDQDRSHFKGLVGSQDWAVELTEDEFHDFCRLVQQLGNTLQAMAAELMPDEKIVCEQETARIWVEVSGFPREYELRFILLSGRGAEGGWSAAAVPGLLTALGNIDMF